MAYRSGILRLLPRMNLAQCSRHDHTCTGSLDRCGADHAWSAALSFRAQREIEEHEGRDADRSDCCSHDHPDLLIVTMVFHSIMLLRPYLSGWAGLSERIRGPLQHEVRRSQTSDGSNSQGK